MAYFANGFEGELFQAENCDHCVNWKDNGSGSEGCPILDAHMLFAYQLCNEKDQPGKVILDMLIPDAKPGETPRCAMLETCDEQTLDARRAERARLARQPELYARALKKPG